MSIELFSDSFFTHGWLRQNGFFDPYTTAAIRAAVDALGAASPAYPQLIIVPEESDPRIVCRYEYVLGSHPKLRETLLRILGPVLLGLCGETFVPFKDKVNNKHPGGGAYRPHQDIVAYAAFPPRYHVTAMLTIDPATIENGCLWVANDDTAVGEPKASMPEQRAGRPVLESHVGGPLHGDIRHDIVERLTWRPLETQPSDLVLLDSFVPHYSERNASGSPRRAMFVTFSAAQEGDWYERYYNEKRKNPLDPKFHVSTPTRHDALDDASAVRGRPSPRITLRADERAPLPSRDPRLDRPRPTRSRS